MKKIFLLVTLIVTLIGCTNSNDKLFEKKQECAKYIDTIKTNLKEDSIATSILEEIFYSPSLGSCVYTYKRIFYDYKNLGYELYIIDHLSNKQLWYGSSKPEDDIDTQFRNELEKYKK